MDDEPLVRDTLSRILRRAEYVVFDAADADAALQILKATCIGVVLIDRRMPGRDGDWLVAQVQEQFSSTAIVVATGDHVPSHAGLHSRIAGYLSKPFTVEAVRQAVADAAAWHRVAARHRPDIRDDREPSS